MLKVLISHGQWRGRWVPHHTNPQGCGFVLFRIRYHSVTPQEFQDIEAELELNHPGMAAALGVSLVSVKRMATGAQVITEQSKKQLVMLLVIHRHNLETYHQRLLQQYHGDTVL